MWLSEAVICTFVYQLDPWHQLYNLALNLRQVMCNFQDYWAISTEYSSLVTSLGRAGANSFTLYSYPTQIQCK